MHRGVIALYLLLVAAPMLFGCADGSTASDHETATAAVVGQGLIHFKPISQWGSNEPLATFGLPVMGETTFVSAEKACEGSAGSVLPPLGFNQCSTGFVMTPFWNVGRAIGAPVGRTVALPGLEKFWIQQKQDNLCWAAALETVRGYLGVYHIPHQQMPQLVAKECPKLPDQKGAEIYQIAYVIVKFNKVYDNNRLTPHTCTTEACIIQSLLQRRPVIALRASHAIVVQGVEIADGTSDMIAKWYILDPAGNGQIEARDPLEMCRSDAFIAL